MFRGFRFGGNKMEIDLKIVINDLAEQIKRLVIELAFLKAQIQKLESDKKE